MHKKKTLDDWLSWQEEIMEETIVLGLERVQIVYERLFPNGVPFAAITVAGTNGKGSTIAFIDSIYRESKYKVGRSTSPHLINYNERFAIDGLEVNFNIEKLANLVDEELEKVDELYIFKDKKFEILNKTRIKGLKNLISGILDKKLDNFENAKEDFLSQVRRINHNLSKVDFGIVKNIKIETLAMERNLHEEITSIWKTDELKRSKPKPTEEAQWGLAVIEDSLWNAVPKICSRFNESVEFHTGKKLPIDFSPLVFGSWMGGDRDGNPNVTAKTTEEVILLSRWEAANLYEKEFTKIIE